MNCIGFDLWRVSSVVLVGLSSLLGACGGKEASQASGAGTPSLTSVAPALISGDVGACATGSAHPNVCCVADPDGSSCGSSPDAPFQPCAPGSTTYPDPRTCCSLDNPASCSATAGADAGVTTPPGTICNCPANDPTCVCAAEDAGVLTPPGTICNCPANDPTCVCAQPDASVSPPPSGIDAGIATPPGTICNCPANDPTCVCSSADASVSTPSPVSCTYGCPPGEYAPANEPAGTCCVSDGNTTACSAPVTNCPEEPACPDGDPCVAPVCSTPAPSCAACPPGWQPPSGSVDLCCKTLGSNVTECFSQATGPSGSGGSSGSSSGSAPGSVVSPGASH